MGVTRTSTEVPTEIVIESRFCGPPDSGTGGDACGMVASFIDAPLSEVTLHLPPPLDAPMTAEAEMDGARLVHDGNLVARGRPIADLQLAVPAPVGMSEAIVAAERSPLHHAHPFPTCFVCGPERSEGDALRIIPGPVEGRELVAAPWTPDESLAPEGGPVADRFCWAALDCPSGNALMLLDDVGTAVLGTLAVRVVSEIEPGRDYVVAGWPLARDGRKVDTASVLFTADGEPAAMARARWIELRTETLT